MILAVLTAATWLSEFFAAFKEQLNDRLFGHKEIGEEISKAIMQIQMFFKVGDYKIIITDAVIVTWIAVVIMLILVAFLLGKSSNGYKLTKGQTILVSATELIISTAMGFGMNRKQAEEVTPMIMTLGLVLIACNSISYFHLPPPAKNVAFPIGCAITAILYVIIMTIKFVGLKGFWISLTQPIIIMLPFKLLDYVVKPLSLALRLFGNVFCSVRIHGILIDLHTFDPARCRRTLVRYHRWYDPGGRFLISHNVLYRRECGDGKRILRAPRRAPEKEER